MRRKIPSTFALAAFEAAARRLSVTQAAKELHITQSAVSHQVIALEKFLGVPLFTRARQRLALTDAGHMLLARVAPALNAIEAAVLELIPEPGRGTSLRIGAVPPYAAKWLIPRLPALTLAHPDLMINLVTKLEPFDFADTELDAAIYYGTPSWPGTRCDYLMGEEMVVVCSPLLRGKLNRPDDLRHVTLLHQNTRPHIWREWARAARLANLDVARGPCFDLFSMIAQAAISGLGAAVLPRFLILNELAAGQLVIPFGPTLKDEFACYLVYPERNTEAHAVKSLRAWLAKEASRRLPDAIPLDGNTAGPTTGAALTTAPAAGL